MTAVKSERKNMLTKEQNEMLSRELISSISHFAVPRLGGSNMAYPTKDEVNARADAIVEASVAALGKLNAATIN
jgi:hypothetical protein